MATLAQDHVAMHAVKNAIYLAIFLHFLRRIIRKSRSTPSQAGKPFLWGTCTTQVKDTWLEAALKPCVAEVQEEIDREILQQMTEKYKREHSCYGFGMNSKKLKKYIRNAKVDERADKAYGMDSILKTICSEVRVSYRDGVLNVKKDVVLSNPVRSVNMTVTA